LSRIKVWSAGEVLLASDLNGEYNNILNNALTLISPLTGSLDLNGNKLVLDADADTSITADTDDQLDFKLGGTDIFAMKTVASAVNGIDFKGAATGNGALIAPVGSDTDIDLVLQQKGQGNVTVESLDSRAAYRYHGKGFIGGLYINQLSSGGDINIGNDVEFNGTNYIARDTSASMIRFISGGTLRYYADSSLTAGNSYTPTNRWQIDNTGKQTGGTVPLARMGTSVLDSSSALTLSSSLQVSIQAGTTTNKFYVHAIRGTSNFVAQGARANATPTLVLGGQSVIIRRNSGGNDTLELVNAHPANTVTFTYKVYDLTET